MQKPSTEEGKNLPKMTQLVVAEAQLKQSDLRTTIAYSKTRNKECFFLEYLNFLASAVSRQLGLCVANVFQSKLSPAYSQTRTQLRHLNRTDAVMSPALHKGLLLSKSN